ncbi:rhodanese-related sulfurtransferase [Rhizomicrobium palustre]|uniref:Rhodanese-related sulfurtransferase n=1 Tax=Rhizomicrobium palustre TaxID=189966 RepID=A0A846N2Z1_9PROT|nr:rhodanese-like domain-containing protein [Rhizomicrobium palustre]NIK90384.1 rhodanese-related sulfurtransferase [Rhizomicrobium palustre]
MVFPSSTSDYAGDVSVTEAWELISQGAVLVDVRTAAEWAFVGLPDLSSLGRTVARVEWQSFPSGQPNPGFLPEVVAAVGEDKDAKILFLCRSGARSRAAAIALTAAGYENCFNVAGGFEGDLDQHRQRGKINGWKAEGLPWAQT